MSDTESDNTAVSAKKKTRERHNCCVPQCSDVKTGENHLHQVPKDLALRKKWAIAIKTGKDLSDKMAVCSKHFTKEDYKKSMKQDCKKFRLKPDAVPSLNLPKRTADRIIISPVKRKMEARNERAKKRATKSVASTSGNLVSASMCDNESNAVVADGVGDVSTAGGDADYEDVHIVHTDDERKLRDIGIQVDLNNSSDSLTTAFDKLAPASTYAAFFDLTIQTCCNYFYDSVIVLSKILTCMIVWPDKEKILKNMPKCFRHYKSTRAILDAYEIPVEKPKCIACRIRLYSHYKKKFTAKVMMICTPSGLVSHCGSSFGGRASDKVVTQATGVYGMCDPGDGLMVDKGFDIDKECQDSLLALIRPPFMRSKTKKFSRAESVQCAKIARARVHVERIIQRVREYHILKFKVPWNIVPYLVNIVVIVCGRVV
ncbi:uncharacterized protein LOC113215458 [Frankliniella occidentalis]|uniref:Uncharacterized protein LOC113215458 n=1 Tax=Frankliniella occidentalis TaxID=133901 RepID=A0A9C6WZE6_FRAOC|nr:uncharacterized protein LOC113215458 [Frankliniella occidentalis]